MIEHEGHGLLVACSGKSILDLILRRLVHGQGDVTEGREVDLRLELGLILGVGELEESQRTPIGQREEGVAVRAGCSEELVGFRPRGDQRQAEDVFVERPGRFLIFGDPGVMVQTDREGWGNGNGLTHAAV